MEYGCVTITELLQLKAPSLPQIYTFYVDPHHPMWPCYMRTHMDFDAVTHMDFGVVWFVSFGPGPRPFTVLIYSLVSRLVTQICNRR